MKKIFCFLIVLISCKDHHDHPCEDINDYYIMELYKTKGEDQKEKSKSILKDWIKELREHNCSPNTYYEYYKEVDDNSSVTF